MDSGVVVQTLFTVVYMLLGSRQGIGKGIFKWVVTIGAVGIPWLGVAALWRDLQARHFEGFVLIVAVAVILESMLTFAKVAANGRRPLGPAKQLDHGFTPGYFVIGESPVFRKPTVFRLGPS